MRFGAQLWSQQTTWPEFRDAALRGRGARLGLGLDVGPPPRDLRAVGAADLRGLVDARRRSAAVTSRVRLGLMVGANTFRNPGLTAKLATTLDHVSERPGRPRHRRRLVRAGARGVRDRDWGSGFGERLDRLDESVDAHAPAARRRAVHATRAASTGSTTRSASRARSRPTCRSSSAAPARRRRSGRPPATADAWNTAGTVEEVREPVDILDEHCADVGRDRAEIELTISFPIVIRDDRPTAARRPTTRAARVQRGREHRRRARRSSARRRSSPTDSRRIAELGFATVIVRLPGAVRPRDDRPDAARSPRCSAASARVAEGSGAGRASSASPAASAGRSSPTGSRPTSASG